MTASELTKSIVVFINERLSAGGGYEVICAYDKFGIHQPLEKVYFTVMAKSASVSRITDEQTAQEKKQTQLTVLMTAFAPFSEKSAEVYTKCETVLDYLYDRFAPQVSGYKMGQIAPDNDTRAFKLPCEIYFKL